MICPKCQLQHDRGLIDREPTEMDDGGFVTTRDGESEEQLYHCHNCEWTARESDGEADPDEFALLDYGDYVYAIRPVPGGYRETRILQEDPDPERILGEEEFRERLRNPACQNVEHLPIGEYPL